MDSPTEVQRRSQKEKRVMWPFRKKTPWYLEKPKVATPDDRPNYLEEMGIDLSPLEMYEHTHNWDWASVILEYQEKARVRRKSWPVAKFPSTAEHMRFFQAQKYLLLPNGFHRLDPWCVWHAYKSHDGAVVFNTGWATQPVVYNTPNRFIEVNGIKKESGAYWRPTEEDKEALDWELATPPPERLTVEKKMI